MSHRIPEIAADSLFESVPTLRLHDQRAITPRKIMTTDCQPFLPLGDVVLPQPDPTPRLVEEVLNRFDFQRVQAAMRALNWTYLGETESPSIETLRATARRLLETVAEEKEAFAEHQIGGFRACWYPAGTVALSFVVEAEYSRSKTGPQLPYQTNTR
jgi:hypothetical protein